MSERLVVIGGDAGGMAAASQAKRIRPDLDVVAFEKGTRTSFAACGIPFYIGGEVSELDDLVARSPEEHRSRGLDVRTRHEVVSIDCASRSVTAVELDTGRQFDMGFDQLVIATGARPLRPPIPGIDDREFVFGVQNLDDAELLLAAAAHRRCRRVVVVGAGYIGLEMAEAFCTRGFEVVVVERAPQVMRTLDDDMAELIVKVMVDHGIDLRTDTEITGFGDGAVHTDGGAIDADLVVLGMGVTPNSELAERAGIALGARNSVHVDDHLRTSVEGVWAAGDCAESYHRVTGKPTHIPLGTVANRQARVAGVNIGGGDAVFPGVLGSAVTKLCETEIGRTGLTEAEAIEEGFAVEVGRIEATTRSGYFPGASPITVKLVGEKGTGRLLGGQIVGGSGSAKRIDTVATAIWNDMAVADLVDLDLAYAPPFSPVWDPVQVAARAMT
jgi:NADPH-dependent 2,4-dienoyl-CoA reductase/sulfur reductase-like enzyme